MVLCEKCGELVPSRPGRGGVIVLCPRDGSRLEPGPGGTPLRPPPPLPSAPVIDPGPRELPSVRAQREPPLREGERRAGTVLGRCIQHPDRADLVARVLPEQSSPHWVEIENSLLGRKQISVHTPVTPVDDVPADETEPEPPINRQLAARLARQRQP
jgi:hypothetical protein